MLIVPFFNVYERDERMTEESKAGMNLNQLTALAHQGKIKEVDLSPTKDVFQQILKELMKLNKKK